MITYTLIKGGSDSLYMALAKHIKRDILSSHLQPEEKLPSKRSLARQLGVSVVTVENAYAQLVAEGYIYALPKRGFYVEKLGNFPEMKEIKSRVSAEKEDERKEAKRKLLADFSGMRPETDLFPFAIWSKTMKKVVNDSQKELIQPSPGSGVTALKESIARYLKDFRDMSVKPRQVVVGAGTEYLYDLLIQLLGEKNIYAVENPAYQKPSKIYESHHVPCVHVPMDKCGLSVALLENTPANVAHISPSHQYPTGILMPISRRYELLAWAEKKKGRYIIEDDYDSELRLFGKPLPTLQSIDFSGRVIYMNTFAKTLSSTVRLSYMILPPALSEAFHEKLSFYSCTVSNFEQYTLARFIDEGRFETQINRLRSRYRKQQAALLKAWKTSEISKISELSGLEAGTHFLFKLHTDKAQETVMRKCLDKGIALKPLSDYVYPSAEEAKLHDNVYVMHYAAADAANAKELWGRLFEAASC